MIEVDERAVYPLEILNAGARRLRRDRPARRSGTSSTRRAARDVIARASRPARGGPLPGPRHRRPLLPALRAAARVRRRVGRGAAAVRRRPRSRLRRHRRRRSAPPSSAWRRAICCWSSRASACSRSARSSTSPRACCATPTSAARTRTRPDGFLLAYGTAVAPGRKQRGSIVDVTPTILYFLGVPIGRDMDGYARADLFTARVHGRAADHVHSVTWAITW